METPDRTRAALRAAHMYYVRDLKMEAIASTLGVSRSSVSRLLSFARESGLVDIRIRRPADDVSRIQFNLRREYGVTTYVVPSDARTSSRERRLAVSRYAGRLIPQVVERGAVVGVAWGGTVSDVSKHLVERELYDVAIVQLNGAGQPQSSGIDYVGNILERFAGALSGRIELLPVPAFFDRASTRVAMWQERTISRVLGLQAQMDVAVFGIGAMDADVPGHVYRGGYLTDQDREELAREGVVGDVATVFLRADGSSEGIELNDRSSGPDLDVLLTVPRRICIVSDPSRGRAVRAALRAGIVSDLIIDEVSARALSEAISERIDVALPSPGETH